MSETRIPHRVNITVEIINAPFYEGGNFKTESLDTLEATVRAIAKKILERSTFVGKDYSVITITRKKILGMIPSNLWEYVWNSEDDIHGVDLQPVRGSFRVRVEMPNK